ncbi:MAG: hypothetical protein JKY31_09295 [Rhodobacteraceae bacterium]|nr:hypothetical protein [Paracoccaceae bacterium]
MFKNDRMMTMLTGLVLAVFAGSMVQYGDRFMAMIAGENQFETSDDVYSVRAGSSQLLDILANDAVIGPIVVIDNPTCGSVALSGTDRLLYSSDASCNGKVKFTYCVDSEDGCATNTVTLNVIAVSVASIESETADVPSANLDLANIQPSAGGVVSNVQPVEAVNIANAASSNDVTPVADPNEAPVVIADVSPATQENAAPAFDNIVISMQAPVLAAPSIDEFVAPTTALSSIRQQNIIFTNSINNTDTNISAQSSTETSAPIEFGVANFGAEIPGESSNIMLGGGSVAPDQQMATLASPQLTRIAPEANPVTNPLERGPVAMADLSSSDETSFGTFTPGDQSGSQIIASLDTLTFENPAAETVNVIAQVEPGQTTLIIERSGPTALIALQLGDSPLSAAVLGGSADLVSPQNEQDMTAQQTAPILLATAPIDGANSVVLAREPVAATLAPVLANANSVVRLLNTSTTTPEVLLSSRFTVPETIITNQLLSETVTDSLIFDVNRLSSGSDPMMVQFTTPMVSDANAGLISLVLARLGTAADPVGQHLGDSLASPEFADASALIDSSDAPLFAAPATIDATGTELASLDTTNVDTLLFAPQIEQQSVCEISLDPSVRRGANILLFIIAPCKPEMPVTLAHAGLEFTILTDIEGTASVVIPALERTAEITATFADGSSATTVALVSDINDVTRAAITWRGEADLNLHAFEYGAIEGDDGHIWSGAARDFRTARLRGGGYLVELGDKSIEGGAMAEVYTMLLGRSVERGIVTMSLEINNGDSVCGSDVSARTIRTRSDNSAGSRSIRFTLPNCGGAISQMTVPGAIDDIRLVAR